MTTLAANKPYNQVFDGQKHYRTLLQATARPGSIGQFDDVLLDVPPGLNRATALIAMALFSADSSFHIVPGKAEAEEFIQQQTAATRCAPEQAEFLIILDAMQADVMRELDQTRVGSLAYPDMGATVIVQVAALSPAPMAGCLRLRLKGPGIESETVVFVSGAPEALFESLRARNIEFPLGVDAFLTCDSLAVGPCAMALPRTTRVKWERV
jgi:alpha-D-ribose 1-methylphosphonate 5-triphosphate synthase subunit PhnH